MSESLTFRLLLDRVRAGDQTAAADLVRQFEPELRRAVRVRLSDPRLRRVVDSGDICQSVLANFFIRASVGEYDLSKPEQLLGLLMVMARNKVRDQARRQSAGKRDNGLVEAVAGGLDELAGAAADPARIVASQDLLSQVRQLLSDEERQLADLRAAGHNWPAIAGLLASPLTPDALRKKLTTALDRVTAQLGLEPSNA